MRILMIAPQPFFEPRGAPFCVYQHIQALTELGYDVDLVTYPVGKSVRLPNLNIFRAPSVPFIREVKPGPSLAKLFLDIFVFFTAMKRLSRRKYQYIFAHEEGELLAIPLARLFHCKLLYYMHCNLAELISEKPFVYQCAELVQRFMVRKADTIIAFYPEVETTAKKMAPKKPVHLVLPPPVDEGLPPASEDAVSRLRQELGLSDEPVLLYTGTLENYQGIDILLRSAVQVHQAIPSARYLIVGGKPKQIEQYKQLAQQFGVADSVRFVGQRPLEEMAQYMALATVLLSPRSKGTHTPLKLYTYLRSGKPILATRILSHTQILTADIAKLVAPTPDEFAQGTLALLQDRQTAQVLGEKGRRYASEHYSWPVFLKKNRQVYDEFIVDTSVVVEKKVSVLS